MIGRSSSQPCSGIYTVDSSVSTPPFSSLGKSVRVVAGQKALPRSFIKNLRLLSIDKLR